MGVPPVFAMVNQIKADFPAARWLAYISQTDAPARNLGVWRYFGLCHLWN